MSRNLRHPTGFLKNFLDDLKIKCDHHDRGCTDEVRLEDLQSHVDKCGFTPVMCGNEECGMVVNKRDKENHERNLCQFRIRSPSVMIVEISKQIKVIKR